MIFLIPKRKTLRAISKNKSVEIIHSVEMDDKYEKHAAVINKAEVKNENLGESEIREEVDTFGSIVEERPINQSAEFVSEPTQNREDSLNETEFSTSFEDISDSEDEDVDNDKEENLTQNVVREDIDISDSEVESDDEIKETKESVELLQSKICKESESINEGIDKETSLTRNIHPHDNQQDNFSKSIEQLNPKFVRFEDESDSESDEDVGDSEYEEESDEDFFETKKSVESTQNQMLNVTDCKALGSEVHADNIKNENNQEVINKQELPSKKSIIPRV